MRGHLAPALAALATVFVASAAFADNPVIVTTQPAPQPVVVQPQPPVTVVAPSYAPVVERERRVEYVGPNRALLTTGIIAFAAPYTASVIVAAESSHAGDQHLYVPVVGPWLDLGNRGSCDPNNVACDGETTNKVLLVLDGIFQGVGVVSIVGSFFMPERSHDTLVTDTAKATKPSVQVVPRTYGKGAPGLAVVGSF